MKSIGSSSARKRKRTRIWGIWRFHKSICAKSDGVPGIPNQNHENGVGEESKSSRIVANSEMRVGVAEKKKRISWRISGIWQRRDSRGIEFTDSEGAPYIAWRPRRKVSGAHRATDKTGAKYNPEPMGILRGAVNPSENGHPELSVGLTRCAGEIESQRE